ncbi:MAG TPA: sigma-70 family RNA polymerase sigma factor [Arenibacter sp.]|nr:sigma-70 family RNA polymerase sigma factor [Arenibacter sp.]
MPIDHPLKFNFQYRGEDQDRLGNQSPPVPMDSAPNISDFELWQQFKEGNEAAFAHIYSANAQRLYSYGLKLVNDKDLIKDCIQDLFVEIWDTKHKLSSVRSIKAYLYKSIRRKLIYQASHKRKKFDQFYKLETIQETVPSIEIRLIEKQRFDDDRKRVKKALDKLNKKQREIIHLKYYGGMGYDEISEIMGLDKKATYNLMAHTIKLLRQDLGGILFIILVLLSAIAE